MHKQFILIFWKLWQTMNTYGYPGLKYFVSKLNCFRVILLDFLHLIPSFYKYENQPTTFSYPVYGYILT